MGTLADYGQSDTVFASLLGDPLHGLPCPLVLRVGIACDVGMRFLAYQQDRKLRVLRVPVVELKGQTPDLGGDGRPHIEWYGAHVDNSNGGFLRTQANEVPQQAFER